MVEVGTRIVCVEIFEHCVRRGGFVCSLLYEIVQDSHLMMVPGTIAQRQHTHFHFRPI